MSKLDSKKLVAALAYADSWLAFNTEDSDHLVGLSVAVQHKDKVVFSKAYGLANVDRREKMTPNHAFRIASHSKTFTATAIAILYERGKLRLDDPISSHLDWFKSSKDPEIAKITIRELLNHTSGLIRDGEDSDYWQLMRDFPDEAELKSYIADAKLIVPRNSRFKYSNFGYSYLGAVVAAASGQPYSQFVTQNIIEPLELNNTGPELDEKFEKIGATGYDNNFGGRKRKSLANLNTRAASSATGFYSTASDLCKFYSAHYIGNETLIKDSTKREFHHAGWQIGDHNGWYGLGFDNKELDGMNWIGHGGGFPGFITNTKFLPEEELTIIVLTNNNSSPFFFVHKGLISIVNYFQTNAGRLKEAAKYTGRFESLWNITDIVDVNGKLTVNEPRFWNGFTGASSLEPTDTKDHFTFVGDDGYDSPGEEVIYEFSDGKLKSLRMTGATKKLIGKVQ